MSGDQIWPILFGISLAGNFALLGRPVLKRLWRNKNVSEDNIMAMVEEGEESGAIQRNEKELIEHVFEFDTMTAKDVMVHRTDMVALALDEDEEHIVDTIRQSGLSRFPVYQEDVDDIIGILSTREYLLNFRLPNPKSTKELLRPAYFVPETVPADVLFRDMQSRKIHMALVVDEYGGTSGLVTLEDLLEELVGNIYDEFDSVEPPEYEQLGENLWRVSGGLSVAELSELVHIEIPENGDYDTVGGMVLSGLRTIPEDGEKPMVVLHGLELQVELVEEHRIRRVQIRRLTQSEIQEKE